MAEISKILLVLLIQGTKIVPRPLYKKVTCPKEKLNIVKFSVRKGPMNNDEALETFLHGEILRKVDMRSFLHYLTRRILETIR